MTSGREKEIDERIKKDCREEKWEVPEIKKEVPEVKKELPEVKKELLKWKTKPNARHFDRSEE